jgi:hypothetical protein
VFDKKCNLRILVLLTAAVCGLAQSQAGQSKARGSGNTMTIAPPLNQKLEVALTLNSRQVLTGAAIPLVVTLRNIHEKQTTVVHSPEADMQFLFDIEPEKGETFRVSLEQFLQKTMLNPPPPREQEMAPLPAGASLDYPVNLAKILSAPLKPGRYKITAIYAPRMTQFRSAPVTLQVVSPRAGLLEVAPNGNGLTLGSVMLNVNEQGEASFYTRESESGKPASGVLRSWPSSPPAAESLAISTDAEGTMEPRWVGWSEAGKAKFLHIWDSTQLHASAPIDLPSGATLLPRGWTFDDGSVVFGAINSSGFSLITIPGHEIPPVVKTFAISGGIANPAMLRAGYFQIPSKTPEDAPAKRLLTAWPDGNRVMCSIVNPEADATPGRELTLQAEPLVALDMESVGREAAPLMHAVFSSAAGKAISLVRLRAGEETQIHKLPDLPESAGAIAEWAVLTGASPIVAVRTRGNQILCCAPGQTAWRHISEAVRSATYSHLRLVRLERPWAVWIDSVDGLRFQQLPE